MVNFDTTLSHPIHGKQSINMLCVLDIDWVKQQLLDSIEEWEKDLVHYLQTTTSEITIPTDYTPQPPPPIKEKDPPVKVWHEVHTVRKYHINELYTFRFTKKKGQSIKKVYQTDPDFLVWFYDNIENTIYSETVLEWIEKARAKKGKPLPQQGNLF